MKWGFALLLWALPALALPWQPSAIGPVVSPPVFAFTCANASVSATTACTGTYTGTAPTSITSATWQSPLSGSSTITSFTASGGTLSFTASTPSSAGTGQLSATSNIPQTALSNNVVISGTGIALVASTPINSGTANGGTSGATNTTGADFEIMAFSRFSSGSSITVSDSLSNTWTPLTASNPTGTEASCQFYTATNPTVGSAQTFSATGTGVALVAQIFAFSGVAASSPLDQQNTNALGTGGTTTNMVSITTTVPNSVVIDMVSFGAGGTSATINDSFIKPLSDIPYDTSVNEGVAGAYFVQESAGVIAPTWTLNAAVASSACIANFHP